MSDIALTFDAPLNTAHPVDLRLGAPLFAVKDAHISLGATIPPPTLAGALQKMRVIAFSATLPAPRLCVRLLHDNAVYRGPNGLARTVWHDAERQHNVIADKFTNPVAQQSFKQQPWHDGQKLQIGASLSLKSGMPTRRHKDDGWQEGCKVRSGTTADFATMLRLRHRRDNQWREATHAGSDLHQNWQERFRTPRPILAAIWNDASPLATVRLACAGAATPTPIVRKSRWQVARTPLAGHNTAVVPPVRDKGCYTPPPGDSVALLFRNVLRRSANVLFSCDHRRDIPATIFVPIKRTTIVLNNVHLIRVDGNLELPATALSLSIDMDSWTWKFNASLPASSLSLVEPGTSGDPVLLEASINGGAYLLLAENITRERSFGKSTISVSGRGHSAMLTAPYSPILSFSNAQARTAQQLMNDALTTNGVGIGWAVDWRIDDWLVTAGAWSHQGNYMSAVTTIAAAAGAFIQPDPVNKIIRVRPRYPAKPWEWYDAVPDIELPAEAIVKESIAWTEKPIYNAVYVSGTTEGGILGHVKRTGSAGDLIAPMVTDALITEAAAARQRGLNVLADTGRVATYALSLPILRETGIIDPGTLVRYMDKGKQTVGVVKGVSVNVALPSIRQTIEVQTHG